MITGRIVDKDSGNRRVRKSVDACRYILVICDEVWREEAEPSEEIEEESNCEDERVSLVGLRVVAMEPTEVILVYDFAEAGSGGRKERERPVQRLE